MYNPPYGYGSGSWQGYQQGQMYPQHNYPSPQYQQPIHSPNPSLNTNQPYSPTGSVQWSPTPVSPMMHHTVQYPGNYSSQPAPPGTNGYFNYNQVSNNYYNTPNTSKVPPTPSFQASVQNHTLPVQVHANPHSSGQMYTSSVSGQVNQSHTSHVPGIMNHNYPVPGQVNNYNTAYSMSNSYPSQNSQTVPPPRQSPSFQPVSHNFNVPGNASSFPNKPPLPTEPGPSPSSNFGISSVPGSASKPPLPPEPAPTPDFASVSVSSSGNGSALPSNPSQPPLPPGSLSSHRPPLPGSTSMVQSTSYASIPMDLESPSHGQDNTTNTNHMSVDNISHDPISHSKTANKESRDSFKHNKAPIDCGDSSVNSHSRSTSRTPTKKDKSRSQHTSKNVEQSSRGRRKQDEEIDRGERDSPRKRKGRPSPSASRLDTKRRRHESESRGTDKDKKQNSRSGDSKHNTPRSRHDLTPHKDKREQHALGKRSFSQDKVNRQRMDDKGTATPCNKHSESIRRDTPLRCVSPPPPDVNRKIKFIVPEDYYKLTKEESQGRTVVTATKLLEKVYANFEKKVLNPSTKTTNTQDKSAPCPTEEVTNKAQGREERMDDEAFDFDSLDGSEFEVDERRNNGEYTADTFATNGDSDDSDDDDEKNDADVSDCNSSSDDECCTAQEVNIQEIRKRKLTDSRRLHPDLWFNEKGEGNDGPVCKCCPKDKEHGIRHGVYPGEKKVPLCNPLTNNPQKLHHYWVTITPHCNFMTERPTVIRHKDKDYTFEGFSLMSHESLDWVPTCSFIRFNIEYKIHLVREPLPKNFCVKGIELLSNYLFCDILELYDWSLKGENKDGCPIFHFMPRFLLRQRDQKGDREGHELLSNDKVLAHLIRSASELLIKPHHLKLPKKKERPFARSHYNSIVTKPNKKPAAFRIDNIIFDNDNDKHNDKKSYPVVLHHGIRPVQMSYAGNPQYQKLWKSYLRLRSALVNKPVRSRSDNDRLVEMKINLERMRMKSSLRRDMELRVSSQDLRKTGINSDVCQHAMVLPVIAHHIRYHMCLKKLDSKLGYKFKDRTLLQLALTHPSYHLNFGMNPDQARNTLTNCGVKLPRYGDRKIHRMNSKKKGITQLIRIMANLGKLEENQSIFMDNIGNMTKMNSKDHYRIRHNERLEFLGDAVLEFICSTHLFYMLPDKNEGDLAMFRSALVQNSHLAALAKSFNLSDYMQYSHGPDLCKEEDLDHAMANCFEAILGAIFLEGGLPAASTFFTRMAFRDEKLREVWTNAPKHPLQIQEPTGDRHLISASPVLQHLQEFEDSTGITFNHIRLLARAFTHPQVGFNNLTLGDNQRMEFLGDSVLQFIVSIYLYRHFPEHHEGHLTLLRSSLVNNHTQADVSRQLKMDKYINFGSKEIKNIREKLLADVLEAFLAALYIDKGLKHVEVFCRIYFFPRVEENIVNQEWIDSKSQLQQCCLTLREEGKQPDLPIYKVLQDAGPSHQKKFQVGVYYKGKRVGTGEGQSMHLAEMMAAKDALTSSYFPEMARQKHLLDGKHQEKRTRKYEPSGPREKSPTTVETTSPKEPQWVEDE